MIKRILAVAVFTLLASCAGGGPFKSHQQAVFAAKQSYAVALTAAVAYKRLPPCPTATKICSEKDVVTRLQKADDAAFALMEGAQKTVDSGGSNVDMAITAATQAVAAFTSITKTLAK